VKSSSPSASSEESSTSDGMIFDILGFISCLSSTIVQYAAMHDEQYVSILPSLAELRQEQKRKLAVKTVDQVDITKLLTSRCGSPLAFGKCKGRTWKGPVQHKSTGWVSFR
jgi:hypothetical protein